MTGQRVPEMPDPRPRLEEFLSLARQLRPMPPAPADVEQLQAPAATANAAPDEVMAAIHAGHVGQVTIFCDECGVEETNDCTGETREVRFAAARRYLVGKLGWYSDDCADLCPACRRAMGLPLQTQRSEA